MKGDEMLMAFLLVWWDSRSFRAAWRWLLAAADEHGRIGAEIKRGLDLS